MTSRQQGYLGLILLMSLFIFYVLYMYFIYDPQAAAFLGHKEDLKRPLQESLWLNIMAGHIIVACVAMIAGAIGFSERLRRRRPDIHRIVGYLYVGAVMLVVLSSGYMAPYATGGKMNSVAFNMMNLFWPAMTVWAVLQIRKKRLASHRRWNIRSYAFCYTNLSIHLITTAAYKGLSLPYVLSYTIGIYATVPLLLLVAEVIIRTLYPVAGGSTDPHAHA
ncbi:DUF2306 domain-containing protein [Paenibacillus daejeonensis]|uniref:DUF2306 domain-containing protein n=1 Tax=Paenibacillus daejeonensis TaxID=135193 RepID=UPI00036569EB|nr:DUF2306 domain-containing protein [Paenibacillus daejeonensis]